MISQSVAEDVALQRGLRDLGARPVARALALDALDEALPGREAGLEVRGLEARDLVSSVPP